MTKEIPINFDQQAEDGDTLSSEQVIAPVLGTQTKHNGLNAIQHFKRSLPLP